MSPFTSSADSQASPTHTYRAAGTYDVSLSVTGSGGTNVEVQEDRIVVTGFVQGPRQLTNRLDLVLGF